MNMATVAQVPEIPAVSVALAHGGKALLVRRGRAPAKGLYAFPGGKVEPGETLEEAVIREVREETNIVVADAVYMASQPWPFPSALMLGFHAEAQSTDIQLNDGELIEARWLSRADISAGRVLLPPPISIAFRLIESWFDQVPGPGLSGLAMDWAAAEPARR